MIDRFANAVRVLIWLVRVALGYFEPAVMKSQTAAGSTWLVGLGALSYWIAYSAILGSKIIGAAIFGLGLIVSIVPAI